MPMPEAAAQTLAPSPGVGSGEIFSSVASLVGTCVTAFSMIVAAKLRFAQADRHRARRGAPHKAMPRREQEVFPRCFGRKARTAVPTAQRRHRSLLARFAGRGVKHQQR